ncbi:MAG: DinB family protein [Pseudonocardia sp.]|nr:DinB family protein [Pseudonocardia sp.]
MTTTSLTGERADLLETLGTHRQFLRHTTRDLSDADAARRTTASELCLGGLIKHVATTEESWMAFVLGGADAMGGGDWTEHHANFQMAPGDTLAAVLERYAEVARRTDELVATLPDLDLSHPLPEAPWFEPGAHRSARRVLLHVIAETAQRAGHADILRESLDGAKTMG